LNGHSYTFGELDVGSLDLGSQANIGTSIHTGAFRSEGVSGHGYFARELLADISDFPHYLPTKEFKQRRDAYILCHAGDLVRFPKEIRVMIYELCCLPSSSEDPLTRSVCSKHASMGPRCPLHLFLCIVRTKDTLRSVICSQSFLLRNGRTWLTRPTYTNRTPKASMLLSLQTTCSFLHEEITTFLYSHHVFYFNTPIRLANFIRCLSFGPVPPPLNFGTVILEIRRFWPLDGIEDLSSPVTMQDGRDDYDVKERDYSLAKPYDNFKDLCLSNLHFFLMKKQEVKVTRKWHGRRFGMEWEVVIKGLVKHKVKKLILRAELGTFDVWDPHGPLCRALHFVGESRMVDKVVVNLGNQLGGSVPERVVNHLQALMSQYGWD